MDTVAIAPGTPVLIDVHGGPVAAEYFRHLVRRWGFDGKIHVEVVILTETRGPWRAGQVIDIAPQQIIGEV